MAVLATFSLLAVLAAFAHAMLVSVDGPISQAVRGEALVGAFRDVTMLGGTEIALLLSLCVSALLWGRCRPVALLYPATVTVGAVLNVVLKTLIDRPRPEAPETNTALASFPSGHTFQATIVLGLLPLVFELAFHRPWLTRAVRVVAIVAIAAVALSRVYLGAHWTSDVVGGALIGVALVFAVHGLASGFTHRECSHRSARSESTRSTLA